MTKSNITMVITSCGRHDLLKQTLESFIACVDIYPEKTVIIEDACLPKPEWLVYPELGDIVWIQNSVNRGQAYCIDRAYAEVKTDYIFHCEDDWLFLQPGPLMAQSLAILEKYPKISTVTLTNHKGWMVTNPDYFCLINKPSAAGLDIIWDGITFNPGLRRLSDYKALGRSFSIILGRKGCPEADVASLYNQLGYMMADLGTQYIRHIGFERRCSEE